jgi:CubicO group peptidase (beta-lactamase class C family)
LLDDDPGVRPDKHIFIEKKAPVDENTLFMVASNTKPLTTLMLAKLVEEGKFSWETPVTAIYPTFKLGSAETTARIRLKHLVCACTGTPRNDWNILEIRGSTPKKKLDGLVLTHHHEDHVGAAPLLAACILGTGAASAQTYPSRPITLVVPYPPGGATDAISRILHSRRVVVGLA